MKIDKFSVYSRAIEKVKRFFPYFLLSIMLLSAACEVLVHTCGSVCELTELASEGGEEKGKEENENSKEVFAWRQLLESHTALAEDLGHRHMTQFIVNSEFNEISIALPELPPEL